MNETSRHRPPGGGWSPLEIGNDIVDRREVGAAITHVGAGELGMERLGRADGVVDDADGIATFVRVEHRGTHAGMQIHAGD